MVSRYRGKMMDPRTSSLRYRLPWWQVRDSQTTTQRARSGWQATIQSADTAWECTRIITSLVSNHLPSALIMSKESLIRLVMRAWEATQGRWATWREQSLIDRASWPSQTNPCLTTCSQIWQVIPELGLMLELTPPVHLMDMASHPKVNLEHPLQEESAPRCPRTSSSTQADKTYPMTIRSMPKSTSSERRRSTYCDRS